MTECVDVLIVGAGPTGLMAACLLARFGVKLRIVDRSEGPAKESRAMVVQARSLELALLMGLSDGFLDRGMVVGGLDVVIDGRPAVALTFDDIGAPDTPFAFPLMIPQSETEAILLDDLEAHGVAVDYGVTVASFVQDGDGVTARIERGGAAADVEAAYLIGADGAHSVVRKTLGLSFEGAAYPQDFLLADCKVDWPLGGDRLTLLLHGRTFAAYFPTRREQHGRVIAIDPAGSAAAQGLATQGSHEATLDEIEPVMRDAAQAEVKLSDPTWTSRYRVHHRGVDRYRVGRAFVAGDAAHIHSPAGGQGMNTGLQDAANLCWKLAAVLKGGAPDGLLDSYHDERWPVGQKVLKRTDRLFTAMTTGNPLAARLRDLAMPAVGGVLANSEAVRARAFRFVSQLGIRYSTGAFVADDLSPGAPGRLRQGIRPGYRAPDARINRTTSVFDLLQADRFHVLALSWTPLDGDAIAAASHGLAALPPTIAGLACGSTLVAHSLLGRDARLIQAESSEVFRRYGLGPDAPQSLILIRPDGHIAFRADRLATEALLSFMARFAPVASEAAAAPAWSEASGSAWIATSPPPSSPKGAK